MLGAKTWRALDRGEVPSWNPSSFSGSPLLATYRPGAFHPLMAALTPLAPFVGFQVLVLLSLALVAPLTYAWTRRVGAEPAGAALAGLAFALGPYLVRNLGDTATVVAEEVAAVAPLLTTHNADGGIEGVKYPQLTVVLVNAIKEQQKQIGALKTLVCADHPEAAVCL